MTSVSNPSTDRASAAERAPLGYLEHGLKSCSMTDPAVASQTVTPEAGKPLYFKMPVRIEANFASMRLIVSQAASEQIANSFIGAYTSAGVRLGVSADQSTAFRSTGEKAVVLTADGGKSLTVSGGLETFVWGAVLVGTQGTTPVQLRGASGSSVIANFGLGVSGAGLRAGTAGTGQSALPSSFTPASLSSAAGPVLLGA